MWQNEALRRHFDAHRDDPGFAEKTVFLSDPKRERELDARLLGAMWPGVLEALGRGRWEAVVDGDPGTPARGAIRTQPHAEIDRALTFLVEDPGRPRRPGVAPPWFCRGTLSCTATRYFVHFDFAVCVPIDFPFPELLRMLSEPRLAGCPPQLAFCAGVPELSVPMLEMSLAWGRGGPWLGDAAPFAAARDATAKNAAAIDAVRELERDYDDAGAWDRVCERLIAAYEAF